MPSLTSFPEPIFMPPRWSRIPDRKDPEFRRLDDRMTFATHVALFTASNSGVWFFRILQHPTWTWTTWMTGIWAVVLVSHAIYIFAVADYSPPVSDSTFTSAKDG
jgi:2TM domain